MKKISEKELSRKCDQYLNRKGWWRVISRTDRPTTQRRGIPDICATDDRGRSWFFELKVGYNKLSECQRLEIEDIKEVTHRVFVIHSVEEMIDKINKNWGDSIPEQEVKNEIDN